MDEFRTIARLWPSGQLVDVGEDSNLTSIPSTFNRDASDLIPNSAGTGTHRFLFWDTGRRLTNKRRVRWNFSVGGWGVWTATRWYGTPGDGPGLPRLRVTPYSIHLDEVLQADAIHAAASSLNGVSPLGAPAWPSGGDAHVVDTSHGPVTLGAVSPVQEPGSDVKHYFTGWLKLVFGGDTVSEFVETDGGFDPDDTNTASFYAPFGSGAYNAPLNDSGEVLAAYGRAVPGGGGGGGGINPDALRDLLDGLIKAWTIDDIRDLVSDPSPLDRLRLVTLLGLAKRAEGSAAQGSELDLISARAGAMSEPELRRSMTEVKALLLRGSATMKSLEAALAQHAAGGKPR